MKTSQVRFSEVRQFLRQLGFSEVPDQKGWRFEDVSSDTVFLFRSYSAKDCVYEHDLFLVRSQLTARGLTTDEAFDRILAKSPA